MESIWRKQTEEIKPEKGTPSSKVQDTQWDVIVVGAGMTGLLTAYYLKERGKKVLVLEADKIASGQTERTTAKITGQHDLKYSKLIQTLGMKKANIYAQANEAAIREYEWLIKKCGIDCQFERVSAYLYTLQDAGRRKTACLMTGFRLSEDILFLHRICMWRPDFKSGE